MDVCLFVRAVCCHV